MLNWKKAAEQDLRDYKAQKASIERLHKRIEMLDQRMLSLKGAVTDVDPVKGGASTYEDHLINAIVEKERISVCLLETENLVQMIEDALKSISEEQRKVLSCFYMGGGGYRRVMEELNVEQTTAYRLRNEALRMFTISMYGIPYL